MKPIAVFSWPVVLAKSAELPITVLEAAKLPVPIPTVNPFTFKS